MPRARSKISVDMFPFLSVLCSVIGVMMLFIVIVISTRTIQADLQAVQADVQEQPADDAVKDADPNDERDGDDEEGVKDGIKDEEYERLEKQINDLSGVLDLRDRELRRLMQLHQEILALLEEKKTELELPADRPKKPVIIDPPPELVDVVPDETKRVQKKPIFVEVSADGYLVQPEKTRFPMVIKQGDGPSAAVTGSPELKGFLDSVDKNRDKEYLLLLIHPNGAAAYENLRRLLLRDYNETITVQTPLGAGRLTKTRIDVGYEPFSRDWEFIANQPKN